MLNLRRRDFALVSHKLRDFFVKCVSHLCIILFYRLLQLTLVELRVLVCFGFVDSCEGVKKVFILDYALTSNHVHLI